MITLPVLSVFVLNQIDNLYSMNIAKKEAYRFFKQNWKGVWLIFLTFFFNSKDLLENQEIELESSFKNHLMHDIIKGMLFIHSSEIKCHGNLTSANCVVDSRFTLKISDFGYSLQFTKEKTSCREIVGTPAWMAPELIMKKYNTYYF